MFRRAVAIGLVSLFALLAVSPWLACAGWQGSASDRHACCAKLTDACPDQASADACCAQKESGNNPSQAARVQADGSVAILPSAFSAQFQVRLAAEARTLALPTGALEAPDESSLYLRYTLLRV
jgi:hypothetical protein